MPDLKTGFAEINGAKIYYEVAGTGHPLVFVHAGIADSRMWDSQFQVFAERYQVVRFDMRGFGKTAMAAGDFSHVQDLYGLLQYLQINHAYFVGCSMGGRVITDLALEYPEMVDALVLVGPGVSGFTAEGALPIQFEEIEKAEEAGDIERVNELELQIWVDGKGRKPEQVNPAVRELVREMNGISLRTPQGLGNELPSNTNAANRLDEIRLPTLIIIGDLDTDYIQLRVDALAQGIAGAQKVVMQGTAHVPNMEQPDIFNRHVLEFLSKL